LWSSELQHSGLSEFVCVDQNQSYIRPYRIHFRCCCPLARKALMIQACSNQRVQLLESFDLYGASLMNQNAQQYTCCNGVQTGIDSVPPILPCIHPMHAGRSGGLSRTRSDLWSFPVFHRG